MSISPPTNLNYNSSNDNLNWEPNLDGDSTIIEYKLEISSEWQQWNSPFPIPQAHCLFDPPPGTYNVKGKTSTGGKTGPPSETITVEISAT